MAHRCAVSGKARQCGHRVSHANNKRKHVFRANIQDKRVYVPELGTRVRLRLAAKVLRTIDRYGISEALRIHGVTLRQALTRSRRQALARAGKRI